ARRDIVSKVQLIDDETSVAAGKALDIMQSSALHAFATTVQARAEVDADYGADLIVVADAVTGGEWRDENGLMLLRRVAERHPRALIVCAGIAQRDVLERGVREMHLSRQRIIGTAPEAL